jgi:tetratricopeptide (TPR) repeat protein
MVMSHDLENNKAPSRWVGWVEGVSIAGAVGGAIATGQSAIMLTALPLSLAAVLNIVQRQRMESVQQVQVLPTLEYHSQTLHEIKQNADALAGTDRILMIQLNTTNNKVEESKETLDKLQAQIDTLQSKSETIAQKQSELMESTLEESYYRRGLELEKREEYKDAIAAYAEALRVNPDYAQAYLQLGSVYAHAGQKQQAIAHLRTATKLFFESGDLERYQTARSLSEEVHGGVAVAEPRVSVTESSSAASESDSRLVVNELFA